MNAPTTETQIIANAILDLLKSRNEPCEPVEVIEQLGKENHDLWQVREVIWELTANGNAELTWDRKLKLGRNASVG